MAPELLAYDDRGAGVPIVLIHGLTFSRRSWDPIARQLADDHRVVALDLPGHGESTGSAADVTALTDRIVATLTSLEAERPVVVGHSAGALHATALAAGYPTSGVINVDQPLLVAPFAELVQQMAPALRGDDFATAFAPFENSIGVNALPEPERSRLAATRTVRQEVVLDHWWLPMNMAPADAQAEIDDIVVAVDAPYLYLSGSELPDALRRYLELHLRALDIVVWRDGGHLPQHADIDGFVRLVRDFAGRVQNGT